MHKRLFAVLAALILLSVLVLALIWAEAASPDANIVSVPSALWYLLTTLTTVGYGDLYPVTAAGRVIGAVFQLMSLGLLGLLIGMLTAFLRGRLLDRLRLRLLQGRDWYVFSEQNEASICLAHALAKEDGKRALLFANAQRSEVGRALCLSAEEICRRKKNGKFRLFCISESDDENERLAACFEKPPCRVYCKSSYLPERLPVNQQRLDPAVLCARLYWDRFPLLSAKENIFIIGDGVYAQALLEQGLIRNVIDPGQHVCYTVAGKRSSFCLPAIEQALQIDPAFGGRDSLTFQEQGWSADAALLKAADHIILCCDDAEQAKQTLGLLHRYFAVSGAVHARLNTELPGVECFGTEKELYIPSLVMRKSLNRRAMELHERYRSTNPSAPRWEALSSFARRSNLAAADHLHVKLRILGENEFSAEACARAWERCCQADEKEKERFRRIEHARWCRFHLLNGWSYAAVRDDKKRLHPLLVPYDRLSRADQLKDDYGWQLLRTE